MKRTLHLTICLWLLLSGATHAGRIVLSATPRTALTNQLLALDVALTNQGNASAHALELSPLPGDLETATGPHRLPPEGRARLSLITALPADLPPGRHAHLRTLRYRDASGAPASAPLAIVFDVPPSERDASPETLVLAARPVQLRERGTLRVIGATLDGAPRRVRLRLALPDEIEWAESMTEWTLAPAGSHLDIALHNLSAPPGSRYPVTVVAEFMHQDRHRVVTAETTVTVLAPPAANPRRLLWLGIALACLLTGLLRGNRIPPRLRLAQGTTETLVSTVIVAGATALLLAQVVTPEILSRTTMVGGDLPAHHYLIDRLRESLSQHGRIIDWAPGWWCGFPLFQFYFPLPYLFMLAGGSLFPATVTFKVGILLGFAATPFCAWLAGRCARLPYPTPALLAAATLPLLLDTTHTMWGVNAYSTLAGMIANSYSFALLLPALGCALDDARRGAARLVTVLLVVGVVASHFFTALLLALLLVLMPLLPAIQTRRALRTLIPLGAWTLALCAGWWLPLIVKRTWSVDFGVNWSVHFWRQWPLAIRVLALPGAFALAAALRKARWTAPLRTFAGLALALTLTAAGLFQWGFALSPVFVNIRLWPFMVFGILCLLALTAGVWLHRHPASGRLSLACFALIAALAWDRPNHIRDWARDNFRGLEARPVARAVFETLVDPLDGTPGRLAYDLHPDNERLGSSRVFELVPHRIDKPILEGGLVNSALGALPAYLVQGEISDATAGFPTIVKPRDFDPETATARLTWLNVRHFIARSPRTRNALRDSDQWREQATVADWTRFENLAHDGGRVRVLARPPVPVHTRDFQADLMDWLQHPGAMAEPFVLLPRGVPAPPVGPDPIDAATFRQRLQDWEGRSAPAPDRLFDRTPIRSETVGPRSLRFTTDAPGQAHMIAESWFPNWRAHGAHGPYPLTPTLMLVYPYQPNVELRYADLSIDRLARAISLLGWLLLPCWALWRRARRRRNPPPKVPASTP